jgi:ribosomal-protein-alanine N-acetyltransferase
VDAVVALGLTLDPQRAEHAAEMFAVLGDPAIYEHENEPPPSLEWLRARFARLESGRSTDGREQWLNWVIRVPEGGLIGYVQATVREDRRATIAYVLSSRHWGRGMARRAVEAMMAELTQRHGVRGFDAVLKQGNERSMRLLERLGFSLAGPAAHGAAGVDDDEALMQKEVAP